MREIEFRFYDKDEQKMHYVKSLWFPLGSPNYKDISIHNPDEDCYEWRGIDDGYLMQYTGLKDKNGTKIFEGDIVRYDNGFGIITWSDPDSSYMCVDEGGEYWAWISELYMPSVEVIGNKFDNPELLEVQHNE